MVGISLCFLVAVCALEHRIVIRVCVTRCAHPIRAAVVHREVSVIKRRTRPGRGVVAGGTGRREPGGLVIRVGRPVVIGSVAAITVGRQRRVIVVYMTAIACD